MACVVSGGFAVAFIATFDRPSFKGQVRTMLERTYVMAANPVPPMSWKAYCETASKEWAALLGEPDRSEADFQRFLEDNPSFVPCNWGEFPLDQYYVPETSQPVEGHHGPLNSALVSQPRLTGMDGKTPDFLWLTRDSGTVYAVLIEIERPDKRWFTDQGHPHSDFTKAQHQLTEWRVWFDSSTNRDRFLEDYQVPDWWRRSRGFAQRYILITGSRSERTLNDKAGKSRIQNQPADAVYMTFDRLNPRREKRDAVTVRLTSAGYQALSIPPTLRLGPFQAHELASISDKESAFRSGSTGTERREFLRERMPYWDQWASSPNSRSYSFETE